MTIRRKDDIGVLSGFTQIAPDIDKDNHQGLMTIPEILDLIKPIQTQFEVLKYLKDLIEKHVETATRSTTSPSDYNLTYVLYHEYVDKYKYTGSFEQFLQQLYSKMELAEISDLNDPVNNRFKLATLGLVLHLVAQHNNDVNAHPEIERSLLGGNVFDIIPRMKLSVDQPSTIKDVVVGIPNYNMIDISGYITSDNHGNIDYSGYNNPLCYLNSSKVNYLTGNKSLIELSNSTADASNYSYLDLTKNFLAISETATEALHYISYEVNFASLLSNTEFLTFSFDYRPVNKTMIAISIEDVLTANISCDNVFNYNIPYNNTGTDVIVRCEPVGLGYKRISITFHTSSSFQYINVHTLNGLTNNQPYSGDPSKICGLIVYPQLEINGYASPRLLNTVSRDESYIIVPINNTRNYLQGTVFIEFMKQPSIEAKQVLHLHFDIFEVSIFQSEHNISVIVNANSVNYSHNKVLEDNQLVRVAVSFGEGGTIIGIHDDVVSFGVIEDMTEIPELDVIVNDVTDVKQNEFQSLIQYPVLETTLLNNPDGLTSDIFDSILPYIVAIRDEDTDTLIGFDSSLGGTRKEVIGIGAELTENDKICIGYNPITSTASDVAFTNMCFFDIAANRDQIRYLINKYTSMFRHKY